MKEITENTTVNFGLKTFWSIIVCLLLFGAYVFGIKTGYDYRLDNLENQSYSIQKQMNVMQNQINKLTIKFERIDVNINIILSKLKINNE